MADEIDVVSVRVESDSDDFDRDLNQDVDRAMRNLRNSVLRTLKLVERQVSATGDEIGDQITQGSEEASREVQEFGRVFRREMRRVAAEVIIVRALLSRLTGVFGGLKRPLLIAGAAASALNGILLATTAIIQGLVPLIAASLAALPGIILGGVVAMGVFKIAVSGVGEALKATGEDAEKFEEAIKDLAPSAQEFVRAIRDVREGLEPLQKQIQNIFFANTADQIRDIGDALRQLGPEARGVAQAFNVAFRNLLSFGQSGAFLGPMSQLLGGVREAILGINIGIQPLLAGFFALGAQAAQFGDEFGGAIGRVLAQFGRFLGQVNLNELIEDLRVPLSQLGEVVGNLAGVFQSVFSTLGSAGANALGILAQLTGMLNEFLRSAEGQQILLALAGVVRALGAAFNTVLGAALNVVGQALIALGPVLEQILPLLAGEIANTIKSLAPAIVSLAPAIAGIGRALAVVLEPLGSFGPLIEAVGQAASILLLALEPIIDALGVALTPIIAALPGIVKALEPALSGLGALLTAVLQPLGPILAEVATAIGQVLAPAAQFLGELFRQLAPVIGDLLKAFGDQFAPLLASLGPLFAEIFKALEPLIPAIISLIPPLAEILVAISPLIVVLAQLLTIVVQIAAPILNLAASLLALLASKAVAPLIRLIADALVFVLRPMEDVIDALASFSDWFGKIDWGGVGEAIAGAFTVAWEAVSQFFVNIGRFFARLAIDAATFVINLRNTIILGFQSMVNGALQRLSSLLSFVRSLPSRILSSLGNLIGLLYTQGRNIVRGLINGALNWIGNLVSLGKSIPGRIRDAVGNLGSVLYSAGKSIISGLINGIKDSLGSLGSVLGGVGNFIQEHKGPLDFDRALLIPAGRAIIQGLQRGLELQLPALDRQLAGITAGIGGVSAGGGGNTDQSITFGPGAVQVIFENAVPTPAQAMQTGQAVGAGIATTLARRNVRAQVRTV